MSVPNPGREMAEQDGSIDAPRDDSLGTADGADDLALDHRALLAAFPGAWMVVRADAPRFTVVEASEDYVRAAMVPREELLGRGLFEVMTDANPENPDPTGETNVRASFEEVIRTRAPHRMAVQRFDAERPDGSWEEYYWEPLHTPLFGEDGEVALILETLDNVTGRVLAEQAARRAEQQLHMAFLQAPALVAVTEGADHRFVLANPAYEEVVGRGRLTGRTVGEALPELERQGAVAVLDTVYSTAEAFAATEQLVTLEDPGGRTREGWYNFVYQPLLDAEGAVTGILHHAVEVSAQVRARLETEAAREEAERANRAKSDFLAVMSHELRTPLNAISGYAELLEMGVHGPVTEAQLRALDRIRVSQQHLLGLINDVLNYARLETGRVQYAMRDVRVGEVLATVEALVAPQVQAAGLTLDGCQAPEEMLVRADPEKLRQILLNLLSNAIKFTPSGEGEARGRIELICEESGDDVVLRVRDTGVGIPPEKLESIFEPFVQVRGDLTRTAEGTGLGLAISRDLAEGMGGELWAESRPGEGSTFKLRLRRGAR